MTYIKFYENEDAAYSAMRFFNHSLSRISHNSIRVMVDGPEDNFAVVNLKTAQELAVPYTWAF